MKIMLKTPQDVEDHFDSSALKEIADAKPKPKPLRDLEVRPRDSGYGTDLSPASATSASTPRQFRFDSDIDDFESSLEERLEKVEIGDDVFAEDNEQKINKSESCDSDTADREVEELLSDSGELGHYSSVTQPVEITPIRPGAPVPQPHRFHGGQHDSSDSMEGDNENGGQHDSSDSMVGDNDSTDYSISRPFHHIPWSTNRNFGRNVFRPISRSVGTQTPSPVSQIVSEAIGLRGDSRFQPYRLIRRGTVPARLRFQSESEEERSDGPLPDVVPVPFQRDRSVSLPEVQALRQPSEQEVGRELRRISDEFHSSFRRVRMSRTIFDHASSFPLNFDLARYWNSIRAYLSPVQQDPNAQERSQNEYQ